MLDAVFRLPDDRHALAQVAPLITQTVTLRLNAADERLARLHPVAAVGGADVVEREEVVLLVNGRRVDDDALRLFLHASQDLRQ